MSKISLPGIIILIGSILLIIGLATVNLFLGIIGAIFAFVLTLTAWQTRGSQRAAVTAPFFIILFVITIFAQPSEFGQAVFGERWPAIQERVTQVFIPFAISSKGISDTFSTGINCLVDPIGCQRQFQPQTQAEGKIMTIEFAGIDTSGGTQINSICEERPTFLTIKNFGDRTANNVIIRANPPIDIDADDREVGTFEIITCAKGQSIEDGTACLVDQLFEGESIQVAVNYNIDVSNIKEPRGHRVQLGGDIEFQFDVNASLDVVVSNQNHYDTLASQGRLNRAVVPTRDTGGPVRLGIGIFNNEMPIRGGVDNTPILLTLSDQGRGVIKSINIAQLDATGISNTEGFCSIENGKLNIDEDVLEDPTFTSDENYRDTCIVPLVNPEQETFTQGITGFARYTYEIIGFQNTFVSFSATDVCECQDGTTLKGNTESGGDLSCNEFCSSRGGMSGCFE